PELRGREESVPPCPDWTVRVGACAVELRVAVTHDAESVVVVTEPDMQAVLLDTAVDPPAGRPLPAEAEATLEHRDRGKARVPAGLGEPPCSGKTGHAAAEDHYPR